MVSPLAGLVNLQEGMLACATMVPLRRMTTSEQGSQEIKGVTHMMVGLQDPPMTCLPSVRGRFVVSQKLLHKREERMVSACGQTDRYSKSDFHEVVGGRETRDLTIGVSTVLGKSGLNLVVEQSWRERRE